MSNFDSLAVGDFVHDVGRPLEGGRIVNKQKTKLTVYFFTGCCYGQPAREMRYDRAHASQFLIKE